MANKPVPMAKSAEAIRVESGIIVGCPHCSEINDLQGFEIVFIFVCHFCGGPVRVSKTIDRHHSDEEGVGCDLDRGSSALTVDYGPMMDWANRRAQQSERLA